MAKDTINLRSDAVYDIQLNKSMDLNAQLTAQYYTGTTADSIVNFDFSSYTGATLTVKQNYKSNMALLTFDTIDGSIILGSDGKFQLIKTAEELANIMEGTFEYSMYLRSTTVSRRAFLSGNIIISNQIV